MAWLSGFSYRKSITISRASGLVTNYQMKLLVGESSGATGEDVDCGGHILSSFDDLRFTTSDEETLLDYWIESITGTTPNQLATVWIEFDSIGTDATTFYMYYGKADAAAYSNGDNTFLFFDHFDGDSINGSKWTTNGTPIITVSSSVADITCDAAAAEGIFGKTGFSTCAMRVKAKIAANDWCYVGFYSLAGSDYALWGVYASGTEGAQSNHAGAESTVSAFDNTIFYTYDIKYINNTSQVYIQNGATAATHTTKKMTATDVAPRLYGYKDASNPRLYVDWVLVRQYLATEPAWGSWGDEDEPSTSYDDTVEMNISSSMARANTMSAQDIVTLLLSSAMTRASLAELGSSISVGASSAITGISIQEMISILGLAQIAGIAGAGGISYTDLLSMISSSGITHLAQGSLIGSGTFSASANILRSAMVSFVSSISLSIVAVAVPLASLSYSDSVELLASAIILRDAFHSGPPDASLYYVGSFMLGSNKVNIVGTRESYETLKSFMVKIGNINPDTKTGSKDFSQGKL